MAYKPGIYATSHKNAISNEAYHADSAISASQIREFFDSPLQFKFNWQMGGKKTSKAMELGSAAHVMFLEPDTFDAQCLVEPKGLLTRRSKGWDALVEEAQENGRIPLLQHEYETLQAMREVLMADPFIRNVYDNSEKEASFFAMHPEHDVMLRARADIWGGGVMFDYKFTGRLESVDGWRIESARRNRHIQAYVHKKVAELCGQTIVGVADIVQSDTPPYRFEVVPWGDDFLQKGEEHTEKVLPFLRDFLQKGILPQKPPIHGQEPMPTPAYWVFDGKEKEFNAVVGKEVFSSMGA